MEPPRLCRGRRRNIVHPDIYREKKHTAKLRDENLCFYVPMWFKKAIGYLIPIVSIYFKIDRENVHKIIHPGHDNLCIKFFPVCKANY